MPSSAESTGNSLKRVLLATDFSPSSEPASAYGVRVCHRFNSRLYTVTVVPQEITEYVQPPDPLFLRHAAEKKMADFARSEQLVGIDHREMVIEGFVADVIAGLIRRLNIDLVVLGTHGRGGIKKLVLGSLAEEVVHSVSCPVLTVGPQAAPKPAAEATFRRILCATSLIHGSTKALACALCVAEQEQAKLTLLHVLPVSGHMEQGHLQLDRAAAAERLAQLLPTGPNSRMETEVVVEVGAAAEYILKVALERGVELIVIGAHPGANARISAHLPVRISHHVICHAACPVLTVRD